MATRFYLPSSGSPPVTAPALPSGWTAGQTAAGQYPTNTSKTDSPLADIAMSENTASVVNIPVGIYISPPLVGQSITGTVSMVIRGIEGASSSDDSLQVGVYLISGDGSTVQSTLYAGHTEALNVNPGALGQEIASAAAQTRIIPATAVTGQTASAGDRLMILVGYRTHDLSTTPRTTTLRLGDPSATADFALTAGLTTDLDPWVELSADLTFSGGSSTVGLTAAVLSVAGVPVTATPGAVTASLTHAALTLTAPQVTAAPTPVVVALVPAAVAITAPPAAPSPGIVSVGLAPTALLLAGPPVVAAPGPVTIGLTPAGVTIAARPVAAQAGPVTAVLTVGTLSLTAPAVAANPDPIAVALVAAGIVLTGLPVVDGTVIPAARGTVRIPSRSTVRTPARSEVRIR